MPTQIEQTMTANALHQAYLVNLIVEAKLYFRRYLLADCGKIMGDLQSPI